MARDGKFDISTGKFINRVSGEEIPDDEPIFILRARDIHAVGALVDYRDRVMTNHHMRAITEAIEDFNLFRYQHPDRMKEPGVTRHIKLRDER